MKRPFRSRARPKPDYGIDSLRAIRRLFFAGAGATSAGLAVPPFYVGGFLITLLGPTLLALGFLSFGAGASKLAYALRGKFNIRRRILGMVQWHGNEAVLDVGTGRGLLAIGAAKRLRTGTVTAIDAWQAADTGENTLEKAQKNLELARVNDRVELRSDDARDIAFVDNSFDVVLSLLHLHNIPDSGGRAKACHEIGRVLKPGGMAIIADYANATEYARAFEAAGLKVEGPRSCFFEAFTALEIVTAKKLTARR